MELVLRNGGWEGWMKLVLQDGGREGVMELALRNGGGCNQSFMQERLL